MSAACAPSGPSRAALVVILIAAACGLAPSGGARSPGIPSFGPITPRTPGPPTPARGTPAADPVVFWLEAPIAGDPSPIRALLPATGAIVERGRARLLRPTQLPQPRRIGIQVGHWKVTEVPAEFPNLRFQGGGSFDGVDEVDVNLDIAARVASLLRGRGFAVDVLPATIPPGYLADAFVALHADGDVHREASGFKIAHGFYRTPHDAKLVESLTEAYARSTGLPWDDNVSSDMTDYYAFAWFRYEHALSPFTPAAIVEMGFLSHASDRELLLERQEDVARGIAEGVAGFLGSTPRSALFAEDLTVGTVAAPR